MKRMVYVHEVDVISFAIASGFIVGDVHSLTPRAKVLAVQIEAPEVLTDLYDFKDFPIFSLTPSPPLAPVRLQSYSYQNCPILVESVEVIGFSSSAVLQIGGTDHIDSEARIKHVRVFRGEPT